MPVRLPQELKDLIDVTVRKDEHTASQIAEMFKVSIGYVKKRKKVLGIRTDPDQLKLKVKATEKKATEKKATDTEEGYKLETPAHGRGKLVRGTHPDAGRKKQEKATPVSLQDIASFFGSINPATLKDGKEGETYLQQFLRGCVMQAINGKEAYASMIFSAIEKSRTEIRLTVENAPGSSTEKQSLPDPLFSAMDDERLRLEAIKVLEARHQQPIEADFKEVAEA